MHIFGGITWPYLVHPRGLKKQASSGPSTVVRTLLIINVQIARLNITYTGDVFC